MLGCRGNALRNQVDLQNSFCTYIWHPVQQTGCFFMNTFMNTIANGIMNAIVSSVMNTTVSDFVNTVMSTIENLCHGWLVRWLVPKTALAKK
jgi:hypothetical protein